MAKPGMTLFIYRWGSTTISLEEGDKAGYCRRNLMALT